MSTLTKKREIYTGRCFRHGTSYGVILPPDIRELAGILPGQQLLMNFEYGILWMVKADKSVVFDRKKVSQIFDKLFPDKAGTNGE